MNDPSIGIAPDRLQQALVDRCRRKLAEIDRANVAEMERWARWGDDSGLHKLETDRKFYAGWLERLTAQ